MTRNNQRYYAARATLWDLGETSTGKEQVAVEFIIMTPDADLRRVTWFGYFTDDTIDRTIESLRIMGWTGNDLSDLQGLDANEVELVVEDETYEGKTRAKVRWVNRPGGLALKAPLSVDRKKAFAASMRDRIKTFDATAGTPKPKSDKPRPATRGNPPPGGYGGLTPGQLGGANPPGIGEADGPPPMSDDDIPF
jgi:hypothetical protein